MSASDRETLGRFVREIWVEHAKKQPDPKPHHLLPWEDLDEGNKEIDRQIGEALFARGRRDGEHRLASAIWCAINRFPDAVMAEDEAAWEAADLTALTVEFVGERLDEDRRSDGGHDYANVARMQVCRRCGMRHDAAVPKPCAIRMAELLKETAENFNAARREANSAYNRGYEEGRANLDAHKRWIGWTCEALGIAELPEDEVKARAAIEGAIRRIREDMIGFSVEPNPMCACGRDRVLGPETGKCVECWTAQVRPEEPDGEPFSKTSSRVPGSLAWWCGAAAAEAVAEVDATKPSDLVFAAVYDALVQNDPEAACEAPRPLCLGG